MNIKATKIALLQSKFHRITKQRLVSALRPFQLQSVDWVLLGLLSHKKKPMAISEVADEVGVRQPFMTVIVAKLSKQNLISVIEDKVDHRKKHIILTKEGTKVVNLAQKQFMLFFAPLARGLSKKDLDAYLNLVTTVIKNAERSGMSGKIL